MAYKKLASYMRITDDHEEMVQIARRVTEDYKDLYTPLMMEKLHEGIERHIPDASPEKKEEMLYRAIYDYWAYGCSVDEEFYLHFDQKTDMEKREFLVGNLRTVYAHYLNSGGGHERIVNLADKYLLSQRLKPYYLRDVIRIQDESDFSAFESFANKHDVFVVKPSNFYYGIGVHKTSLSDYGNNARLAFESILSEGAAIHERHPSRNPQMVVEELIVQDEKMAELHPSSVNAVRATAVRGKDGKIHLFYPWIKVGINGAFVASAALDGFDAGIDSETGVVITDGYQENGHVYKIHPDSGIQIKGFQIPRWDELLVLVDKIMKELPEYGYIGWDLVLTPKGWCVMEGNYAGEFIFQMFNGRGYKKEFEELIGWEYEKDYWWQNPLGRYSAG